MERSSGRKGGRSREENSSGGHVAYRKGAKVRHGKGKEGVHEGTWQGGRRGDGCSTKSKKFRVHTR